MMGFATGNHHIETVRSTLASRESAPSLKELDEALMRAALIGLTAAVKRLLEEGADVNATDCYGWSSLKEAVFAGHDEVVLVLLAGGADVNAKDSSGWTPLMEAASKGRIEAVKTLIEHGADVNARAVNGWTALKAAPKNNVSLINLLKRAGAKR